jgi:hypothetical protein
MSRLQIAIGFADSKNTSVPQLVYLGRSGEEMRLAIAASIHPRILQIPHVFGISKNNPNAAANAAAGAPAPVAAPAPAGKRQDKPKAPAKSRGGRPAKAAKPNEPAPADPAPAEESAAPAPS